MYFCASSATKMLKELRDRQVRSLLFFLRLKAHFISDSPFNVISNRNKIILSSVPIGSNINKCFVLFEMVIVLNNTILIIQMIIT